MWVGVCDVWGVCGVREGCAVCGRDVRCTGGVCVWCVGGGCVWCPVGGLWLWGPGEVCRVERSRREAVVGKFEEVDRGWVLLRWAPSPGFCRGTKKINEKLLLILKTLRKRDRREETRKTSINMVHIIVTFLRLRLLSFSVLEGETMGVTVSFHAYEGHGKF